MKKRSVEPAGRPARSPKSEKVVVGWREWVGLPGLGVPTIKAKIDTGARTSALHADDVKIYKRGTRQFVSFNLHPEQSSSSVSIHATAPLVEERRVRSSNGQVESRPVIHTALQCGSDTWTIEVTLTSRDVMGFRMLLGRQAVRRHALVDPGRSFLLASKGSVPGTDKGKKSETRARKKKRATPAVRRSQT